MANNISDRIQLGKTDIWVSPVGFGVLPMGPGQLALPVEEGAELICYALEKGINFIDTAQYYKTYPYIRRALEMLGQRTATGDAEAGSSSVAAGGGNLAANSASAPVDARNLIAGSVADDGDIGKSVASLFPADDGIGDSVSTANGAGKSIASSVPINGNSSDSVASSVPLYGQRAGDAGAAPTGASPAEFDCGSPDSDFAKASPGANSEREAGFSNAHIAAAHMASPHTVGAAPRPIISSKTLATDYESAYAAILEECEALGVPFIDIFLLHEVRTGQFAMRQGAWRALMDAKTEGLVRAIGVSTHHVDVVEELTLVPECDVIFPLLNYAGMGVRRGSEAASCAAMASAIAEARGAGKGIYIMKALGGGNLAAHYREALDYVFAQDGVDCVMLGFGCRRDIDDIVSYLDGSMPQDYAPDVSAKRVRINQEDCEGCGTCLSICHSAAIAYNKFGLAEIDQSKCITCGYCAQSCPVRAIIMY